MCEVPTSMIKIKGFGKESSTSVSSTNLIYLDGVEAINNIGHALNNKLTINNTTSDDLVVVPRKVLARTQYFAMLGISAYKQKNIS